MKAEFFLVLTGTLILNCIIANDVPVVEWLHPGPLQVHGPGFVNGPNLRSEEFGPRHILSNNYLDSATLFPVQGQPFLWDNKKVQNWMLTGISEGGILEIKPIRKAEYQIAYHAFYIESQGLNKHKLEVESPQMFEVYLRGEKLASNYTMAGKDCSNTEKASLDLDLENGSSSLFDEVEAGTYNRVRFGHSEEKLWRPLPGRYLGQRGVCGIYPATQRGYRIRAGILGPAPEQLG